MYQKEKDGSRARGRGGYSDFLLMSEWVTDAPVGRPCRVSLVLAGFHDSDNQRCSILVN